MIVLVFLASFGILFVFFLLIGEFQGAPFVPISSSDLKEIFSSLKLKKGVLIYDLGSGDGKVLRYVFKEYQLKGVGIEINPYLYFISKLLSPGVKFKRGDLFHENLSGADVLFVYLFPKSIEKLKQKILKECSKGTVVISHGFSIKGWEKRLIRELPRQVFTTYIYRI